MIRLDKYLADSGIGTRTEVKKLIRSKKIFVNKEMAHKPEQKINEETDLIEVNGKNVIYEKFGYYLFYKPSGCVTATKDNLHKTVMDYFPKQEFSGYSPVGRLDLDTEGVLLITNDGALAHHLISPSHHIPKTYYVELDHSLSEDNVILFQNGVDIKDDKLTKPAKLEILEPNNTGFITIYEGRFHQVKRMFKAIDCEVLYLKRVSMGTLTLGNLNKGEYRKLEVEEVNTLKQ